MRQAFHCIRTNPEAYSEGYRNTRRALIRRFPYGVIYLPVPEQGTIECRSHVIGRAYRESA